MRKNVKKKKLIICFNTKCERRNVFEAKSLHTFDERSCSSSGLHSWAKAHTSLKGTEDNYYLFGQNILLNEVQVTFVISRTHCRVWKAKLIILEWHILPFKWLSRKGLWPHLPCKRTQIIIEFTTLMYNIILILLYVKCDTSLNLSV